MKLILNSIPFRCKGKENSWWGWRCFTGMFLYLQCWDFLIHKAFEDIIYLKKLVKTELIRCTIVLFFPLFFFFFFFCRLAGNRCKITSYTSSLCNPIRLTGSIRFKKEIGDLLGGPVVRTLCFQMQGAWVWSLVRELKSCAEWSKRKN